MVETWIVDGANVVGSRPDGWWRDRAGAAARLHDRLVAFDAPARIVLVLEGAARPGVAATDAGPVVVVHAPGSGDDEIVHQAEQAAAADGGVVVITADRELRERVTAGGATTAGPSWLLDRLPDRGSGSTRRPPGPDRLSRTEVGPVDNSPS